MNSVLRMMYGGIALIVFASAALSQEAASSQMEELSTQGASSELAQKSEEIMGSLAERFKAIAVEDGLATEACQTVCTASCTWVNGVCQATTSCSLQCGF